MADYSPLFTPGAAIPITASAAVTGGQLVSVSGAGSVAPTSAATGSWLGVAAFDAASGARLTVHTGGVQVLTASAAITAGGLVAAAATGQVAPFSGTDYSQVVGVALSTASAAGQTVQVKLVR